ncbi:MAG: hypothetical protein AYK19_19090 [Theionarchaea archaeon DG-70-1]|nr:MAG: hypothetical protein AYK19_19090 [Theionarchaea archaeon DG-70-1]
MNYIYDSTGNRIQLNSTVHTYNEMNELLTQEGDTNCTYTYDEYGNCITKTDGGTMWEYYYDDENRLLSAKENDQVTEQYVYDGDGQRIKKIDSDSVRIYIYSGIDVLYEINMTTQMKAVYIYGPTGKIAKKVNDITEHYHTDHLGSTRLTTSENGVTVTEIHYKPFGEQINATEEKYTYTGKELDDTGLYYYGARYYDPETGRFLTRDSLQGKREAPQTLNRYVYCLNNPLVYVDPTGNESEPSDPQQMVEQIFQRLLKLSPEKYKELQEQFEELNLEALVGILELLGYTVRDVNPVNNSLKVIIDDKTEIEIVVDNTLDDYGNFNVEGQIANINLSKCGTIADVAMVALHEISHAVLSREGGPDMPEQEAIIYTTQYLYKNVLSWGGVELSSGYAKHINRMKNQWNPKGVIQAPISNVLVKWMQTQGWKRCRG